MRGSKCHIESYRYHQESEFLNFENEKRYKNSQLGDVLTYMLFLPLLVLVLHVSGALTTFFVFIWREAFAVWTFAHSRPDLLFAYNTVIHISH
jgi:hypothetical protein